MRLRSLVTLIAFLLSAFHSNGQTNLTKVDSVLGSYFGILENFVKDPNSDPSAQRIKVISFFERLTEIEGDGDGTYIGKLTCTEDDIKRWRVWIEKHKENLVWNTSTATIERRGRL